MSKQSIDRRAFLKGAAASAAAVIGTQLAAANAEAQTATPSADGKECSAGL
jgi:secreted PhoX family phosphatase